MQTTKPTKDEILSKEETLRFYNAGLVHAVWTIRRVMLEGLRSVPKDHLENPYLEQLANDLEKMLAGAREEKLHQHLL